MQYRRLLLACGGYFLLGGYLFMNLYHLRYFVTLAHMEHYTRAADLLAITQPSLSHAISSLESELGVKLFKKNGRNVTLTKYGKSFLTDAEDILQKLDSSVGNLQLAGKGEGRIDIAFLRTLGSDFVPRILRRFLDENQGKQIDFALHCDKVITNEILKGIKEQKYDIGFCSKINDEPLIEFIPVAKQDLVVIVPPDHPLASKDEPLIEFIPVAKQDLVVIVPPDHPLASKSEIHLEETLEYKQIIYKSGSGLRHIIDHLFDQIGAYPDVSYEIAEDHVVAGFVANGFGIAVAPDIPIIHSLNLKVLPLVSPTWQRNFYMATLKDAYHPPVVDIFKQFVIDQTRGELDYRTI